jgi:hypothetical protein
MTRRAALISQADINRACRAAAAAGPGWWVEVEAGTGTIRLRQSPPPDRPPPIERDPEPPYARGLDRTP